MFQSVEKALLVADPWMRAGFPLLRHPRAAGIPYGAALHPIRGRADSPSPSFRGHAVAVESPGQRQSSSTTWTRETRHLLRHPREAGIPHGAAEQYTIVTLSQPTVGFPRRARE